MNCEKCVLEPDVSREGIPFLVCHACGHMEPTPETVTVAVEIPDYAEND